MLRLNLVRRCPILRRNYHASPTTPSKGDKGMSISPRLQTSFNVHPVIVAMSGGVDSSVTAKLLADLSNVSPAMSHHVAL